MIDFSTHAPSKRFRILCNIVSFCSGVFANSKTSNFWAISGLFFKISGEKTDLIFDSFCSILSIFMFCLLLSLLSVCSVPTSFALAIKRRISFFDFQANFFRVAWSCFSRTFLNMSSLLSGKSSTFKTSFTLTNCL